MFPILEFRLSTSWIKYWLMTFEENKEATLPGGRFHHQAQFTVVESKGHSRYEWLGAKVTLPFEVSPLNPSKPALS